MGVSACGNSGSQNTNAPKDSLNQKTEQVGKNEGEAQAEPIVAAGEDGFIKVTKRNDVLIFGMELECKPGYMVAAFQEKGSNIMRVLKNSGATISGPMMFVYDEYPASPGVTKFFAGIPVTKEFTAEQGFGFRKMAAGSYYEMDCKSETGKTDVFHEKMRKQLSDGGKKFGLPVYEILSETRNNEMTVVAKSKLIYPAK